MAEPVSPEPVKAILAILWSRADRLAEAIASLQAMWGPLDFAGPDHPFQATDFYVKEMGSILNRRIVSFERLVPPDFLVDAKHQCNEMESGLSDPRGRTVNLDVGLLDHNKVVLASMKSAGQKIYLGRGVWADFTLRFAGGEYRPLEWTFPDFADGRYLRELLAIREIYRRQRKEHLRLHASDSPNILQP
jgi:hypothetical protein